MAWASTRAKIAVTLRDNPDADVTELRQRLKKEYQDELVEDRVRRIITKAPPLTDRQRMRLALIILDEGADHAP